VKDDYDAPKYLTVKQLKEVLEQIPEDYLILPNRVGNLAVYKGSKLEEAEFAGYVSFICDGEYESYE